MVKSNVVFVVRNFAWIKIDNIIVLGKFCNAVNITDYLKADVHNAKGDFYND